MLFVESAFAELTFDLTINSSSDTDYSGDIFIYLFVDSRFSYVNLFLWLCPPDCISAGAGRGPGAGGDCAEVSAEWSLGGRAL